MDNVQRLTGVPDNEVDRVAKMFLAEGASDVRKIPEPGGTWTVEATFGEGLARKAGR